MVGKTDVVLMVNSECNIACKHCYLPYQGARDPQETVELVGELKKQGYGVIIAGSETLLDPRYLKAYQQAGQKTLLTNGLLLMQKPELFEEIRVHGIEELLISAHFYISNQLNSVTEETVTEVVRKTNERGFRAGLETTVTKENYLHGEEMCNRAYEMGAKGIKFLRYVVSGRAKDDSKKGLSEEEKKVFVASILETRKRYGKDQLEIRLHGNFGPRQGSKGEQLSQENDYCYAGKELLAVSPDNKVYGCPFLMDQQIGELVDGNIIITADLNNGRRDCCLTEVIL
ncbi:radical SAM protein [Candidatus Woesearchaeota archaeon]|jgi:MoaA/NifB/PqqE/SkfB family radical SAM enzyme|nr:radical SAM protein [Candidatus Woesearchaeota archaeon]